VCVLAVLAELDREAVKGRSMKTLQKALYDELRAQVEPRNLADDFRLQVFFNGGHGSRLLRENFEPRDAGRSDIS
jgi:hypothetical protein